MKIYGLGLKGEQAAKRFLKKKGYKILDANYQCRFGELDLIAKDKECLVFCEVKTRSAGALAAPQESVTPSKQRKMIKTALFYLQQTQFDGPSRFDVIAIKKDEKGVLQIEHLENVLTC